MSILPVYADSFFASKKQPDGIGLDMLYENGVVSTNMIVDTEIRGLQGCGSRGHRLWHPGRDYVVHYPARDPQNLHQRKTEMDS